MSLIHLAVFVPFIGALFLPFIYKNYKRIHLGYFALLIPIITTLLFVIAKLQSTTTVYMNWMPHIGLNLDFNMDGLSFLFVMLISVIGMLVIFYSISYLSKQESLGHFYTYLMLFMGAMLGVVLSDNVLSLYLFWELTSISSFLLIAFWNHKEKSIQGAMKSMLITVFGGLMLLGGLMTLAVISGTFSIQEMIASRSDIVQSSLFIPAMLFILLAAFTKSAQFPFHIWLPDAMEAPTPVSAYLHSATMVKAGVYLVARMTPIFALNLTWVYIVLAVGAVTLFWASFNAVKQLDLKGVLAYSTVSQLGLMMTLLGAGGLSLHYEHDELFYLAIAACVFHIFNHASFKGALFMIVGIIDHETGTRDLKKLAGLMTVMPITFTLATIAALSMAGVPPFNGFLSKEMFLTSMFDLLNSPLSMLFSVIIILLIVIGSLFTFIYSVKMIKDIFFGGAPNTPKQPHEAPLMMLVSPIILISIVIIVGIIPNSIAPLINNGTTAILATTLPSVTISYWHGVNIALLTTLFIIIVGSVMVYFYSKWQAIYKLQPSNWTFNHVYNSGLKTIDRFSLQVNQGIIASGSKTHLYMIFIALATIALYLLTSVNLNFGHFTLSKIGIYEVILTVLILIATYMIIITNSRIFSVIMLSAIGYSVGLFYVFFNAPDLALTQLTIETISTALFLMCFYLLPRMSRYNETMKSRVTNGVIAITTGLTVTVIALIAYGHRYYPSINEYYIENVYKLAAGKNMVNVILVDFRGFDTLFESAVLGIAGIGIYTLVKLRNRKGDEHEEVK